MKTEAERVEIIDRWVERLRPQMFAARDAGEFVEAGCAALQVAAVLLRSTAMPRAAFVELVESTYDGLDDPEPN